MPAPRPFLPPPAAAAARTRCCCFMALPGTLLIPPRGLSAAAPAAARAPGDRCLRAATAAASAGTSLYRPTRRVRGAAPAPAAAAAAAAGAAAAGRSCVDGCREPGTAATCASSWLDWRRSDLDPRPPATFRGASTPRSVRVAGQHAAAGTASHAEQSRAEYWSTHTPCTHCPQAAAACRRRGLRPWRRCCRCLLYSSCGCLQGRQREGWPPALLWWPPLPPTARTCATCRCGAAAAAARPCCRRRHCRLSGLLLVLLPPAQVLRQRPGQCQGCAT